MMEIKNIQIATIKLAKYNPRRDLQPGDPDYEKLKKSMREFDLVEPLVWNKRSGNLIGGHQRLKILIEQGAEMVDVSVVDLPDRKEKALNLALNKIRGDWDMSRLRDILEELDIGDFDIEITGFDDKEIETLMTQFHIPEEGLTDDDEIPEKVETICKTGDLWQLNSHFLLCGDATKESDIKKLMGGEKADCIWTDPPYGVHYGDKLKKANPMGYRVRTIEGDNLSPDKLSEFLNSALVNMASVSRNGTPIYVACPPGKSLPILIGAFIGSGFDFHWQLVWVKDQLVLSRADYHFRHENILYGWKAGGNHYFTQDRTQDSIFEIPRPKLSKEHPTMKPVLLIECMLKNSSKIKQIVLDPFGGSGSTMIAAEKLGRRCFMMEISPEYTSVILKRWANFTGKEPVKLN